MDNYFASIFDFSFTKFATPKLAKILYILTTVVAGLYAVFVLIALGNAGGGAIILGLILAPVVFFLILTYSRVFLETLVVLHRIQQNTAETAALLRPDGRSAGVSVD